MTKFHYVNLTFHCLPPWRRIHLKKKVRLGYEDYLLSSTLLVFDTVYSDKFLQFFGEVRQEE
jgi:hypothetical protein